jgi:hypothetical protein
VVEYMAPFADASAPLLGLLRGLLEVQDREHALLLLNWLQVGTRGTGLGFWGAQVCCCSTGCRWGTTGLQFFDGAEGRVLLLFSWVVFCVAAVGDACVLCAVTASVLTCPMVLCAVCCVVAAARRAPAACRWHALLAVCVGAAVPVLKHLFALRVLCAVAAARRAPAA